MGDADRHPLMGFYSTDVQSVLSALARLADPQAPEQGRVVGHDELPYHPDQTLRADGLMSEAFFGPRGERDPQAWAVLPCPHPLLHPGLIPLVAELLGCSQRAVEHVVWERAWIDEQGAHFPPGHPGEESGLDTPISAWPPSPPHFMEETWQRANSEAGIEPACSFSQWTAAWYRERGIDRPAAEAAEDGWDEAAMEHTGTRGLISALAACDEYCRDRIGLETEALFFERIPVPPVTQRPLKAWAGFLVAEADNRNLVSYMYYMQRFSRLTELEAPPIILRNEAHMLQHAFDELMTVWANIPATELDPFELPITCAPPPAGQPTWPVPENHAQLYTPEGLSFWGDRRAILDFPTASVTIDLPSGRVLEITPTGSCGLMGCRDSHATYVSNLNWGFAFRDLESGEWLTGPVPEHCAFVFSEAMEQAMLVECETGRIHRLAAVADYPSRIVVSACGRYLYAADKEFSGGVYRFDGAYLFPPDFVEPRDERLLMADGRFESLSDEDGWALWEEVYNEGLVAMAYYPDREIWLRLCEGWLIEGPRGRFHFGFEIQAACFHPETPRLLVASDTELLEIGLEETPRIERRLDLLPLRELFVGPGPNNRKPRPKSLNAVLSRHGTLAQVAQVAPADLARLNQESTFDCAKKLGLAKARRVHTLAQKVRVPERLDSISRSERG